MVINVRATPLVTMETRDKANTLSSLRKKRGIVKRSITRLVNTLTTLEVTPTAPGVVDQAKQLVAKLEGFDRLSNPSTMKLLICLRKTPET